MPHSEYDDDEGYESVGEDAELELSCALHDLAERVKLFEEHMKGRLRIPGLEDDDDEEIGEDIPEVDDDRGAYEYGYASPTKKAETKQRSRRRRERDAKQSKQQDEEDEVSDDDLDDEDDGDDEEEDAKSSAKATNNERNDWDEQNEREELSEMKDNISKLLQGFKEQAKALEASNQ